jgi:hypothetical protein
MEQDHQRQLREVHALLESICQGFTDLQEGVRQAITIADSDPEMSLTRVRKVLELITRDVYEKEIHSPPGTQPLENLLQRLVKDRILPRMVAAYASAVREMGNVGTHSFGEGVTADDVNRCLTQLKPILEWYCLEYCRPAAATPNPIAPPTETIVDSPSSIAEVSTDAPPAVASTVPSLKVVLVYRRSAGPDERLLALLESALRDAGHSVFVDRHLQIGVEWARQIEMEIRSADAVVALLSEASIQSEMLAYEIRIAGEAAQKSGQPKLIPVRIAYTGPLPPDIAAPLDRRQYFLWQTPQDDAELVKRVIAALHAPPTKIVDGDKLESTSGAVPLDSDFYVSRPTDKQFLSAVSRRDSIVLVNGARQMGKTSLLARGLQQARQANARVALTDLQKLNNAELESAKAFFIAMGVLLADSLQLDVHPADRWDDRRGPNANFDRFVRQSILKSIDTHLVWGLDEVDRLFTCPFGGEVFALFRTWHNERALDPGGPWFKLTLAIAYATEAHLFITDVNQSPFNVGTRVTMQDFTLEQVADLNARYGSPLRDGREVTRLYKLIAGHPFLTRRSLHELASRTISVEQLEAIAIDEAGPFGDHLRRILVMLAKDPELIEAVRAILRGEECPDAGRFYRLRSAGIIEGASAHDAKPRCELYATYLRRHLL